MLEEDLPYGGLPAAGIGGACGRATVTLACIEEAERMMQLAGGAVITASITNAAADELELTAGETAYAVVKASDVMIGKDRAGPSLPNGGLMQVSVRFGHLIEARPAEGGAGLASASHGKRKPP